MSNFPGPTLEQRYSSEQLKPYVDLQMAAFPRTPKLMLINNLPMFEYAVGKGAGWRADCLGDWHHFSQNWSHMRNAYPERLASARTDVANFDSSWQRAPVSFEVCGKLSEWPGQQQYTMEEVKATFDWALAQHASTINLKSDPVPPISTHRRQCPAQDGLSHRAGPADPQGNHEAGGYPCPQR